MPECVKESTQKPKRAKLADKKEKVLPDKFMKVSYSRVVICSYFQSLQINFRLLQKEYFRNNHQSESTRFSGQIPVFKVGVDARELTPREILCYQSMLLNRNSSRGVDQSSSSDTSNENTNRRLALLSRSRSASHNDSNVASSSS